MYNHSLLFLFTHYMFVKEISSIGGGDSSAFFPYYDTSAKITKNTSAKSRVQNSSAILRAQNLKFYILEIS